MAFVNKGSKAWKPTKTQRKVKLAKCLEKLRPAADMFKEILKPFIRMFSPTAGHQQPPWPLKENELAFMTCIIKVNTKKTGWHQGVSTLLRNCKGLRFKMDGDGVVEVSGIGNPVQLLNKISKSSRVKLEWFQFGQCSNNLFIPEPKAKKDPPPQEKPNHHIAAAAQEKPNHNVPPYGGYECGCHYPPTQVFNSYLPYPPHEYNHHFLDYP